MKKQHWYEYLWLWPIVYFTLGLFNILFAWMGLIDFLFHCSSPLCSVTRHSATGTADGDSFFPFCPENSTAPAGSPRLVCWPPPCSDTASCYFS